MKKFLCWLGLHWRDRRKHPKGKYDWWECKWCTKGKITKVYKVNLMK